jgi:hypothetical protein
MQCCRRAEAANSVFAFLLDTGAKDLGGALRAVTISPKQRQRDCAEQSPKREYRPTP